MLEKGKTYAYFTTDNDQGSDVTIENIHNGIATATSGKFADMGPFTMYFDADTGEGLNNYTGSRLEAID